MATATVAPAGPAYPAGTPQWQVDILNNLDVGNKLSGIQPEILAAIAQWESGFENAGAGVNAEGYGGYFGLSQSSAYPANASGQNVTGRPLLETNSPASFTTQAEIAAGEFASLLQSSGGSAQQADYHYTGGFASEENAVVAALGGASPWASGVAPPATAPGSSTQPGTPASDVLSIPGLGGITNPLGAIGSLFTSPLNALIGYVEDAGFVIFGLFIIVVGLVVLAFAGKDSLGGGSSSSPPASGLAGDTRRPGEKPAKSDAEHAAEDAAVA